MILDLNGQEITEQAQDCMVGTEMLGTLVSCTIEKDDLVFYKAKDEHGSLIAYVFIAKSYGYSSDISTVVAITQEGNILSLKVLEHRETPGIGSQISENDFLNQFKNQDINKQFDTITGATISSEAVIDSIKNKALEVLKHEQ